MDDIEQFDWSWVRALSESVDTADAKIIVNRWEEERAIAYNRPPTIAEVLAFHEKARKTK